MDPAEEACSVEKVKEALQLISSLVSQCKDSDSEHKEASLSLALMELSRKPGFWLAK